MPHLYGVGLNIEVKRVLTQLKLKIAKRGGIGMRALAMHLARADPTGSKQMDAEEFESALAAFNLFPTKVELQSFMKAFGAEGSISYEKFVDALREPMNARRAALVDLAFEKVDTNCNKWLSVEELVAAYDASRNQDFLAGACTKEQIVAGFLEAFSLTGEAVTQVTVDMWRDYYTDLSMTIVDDNYFVGMLESIWQVSEDPTATVSKEELEHLTRTIRHKLLDMSTGQSDEYVLRNVFREFDVDRSGNLSALELDALLCKLQMRVPPSHLQALLHKFDRNGNGVVEFEEFLTYLTACPYK